jgi:hypothetical protein
MNHVKGYPVTTQAEARALFWSEHPDADKRRMIRNADGTRTYCADTRVAWVDWIDAKERDGTISPELAGRATLETSGQQRADRRDRLAERKAKALRIEAAHARRAGEGMAAALAEANKALASVGLPSLESMAWALRSARAVLVAEVPRVGEPMTTLSRERFSQAWMHVAAVLGRLPASIASDPSTAPDPSPADAGKLAGYQVANFETMKRAICNGDGALMYCQDIEAGKMVAAVCAVARDSSGYVLTPFAIMIDGNPYERLIPPRG